MSPDLFMAVSGTVVSTDSHLDYLDCLSKNNNKEEAADHNLDVLIKSSGNGF